jgi:1-acyl-sn-glycerol-3-phosphate acyltransferase
VGLGRPFVYVAKNTLFRVPFLGWHLATAGFIPVDRRNHAAALQSLQKGADVIRSGTSVTFYAEGTRSTDGSILPFKKGPFVFAMQAGVPVVPVAIEGSLNANPKGSLYVCPNTIRIVIGAAIPTAGLSETDRDVLISRTRASVIRQHRRAGGLGGDEGVHVAASGFDGIGHGAHELH